MMVGYKNRNIEYVIARRNDEAIQPEQFLFGSSWIAASLRKASLLAMTAIVHY